MATGVVLYPLFSEYELSVTLSILKQGNHPIITIGIDDQPIRGESDLVCLPDTTIDQVDLNQLDSLLFSGCMDIGTLVDAEPLFEFIRTVHQSKDVPIAAISSSPFLLAKAGVLKNHRYTVGLTREQRDLLGVFAEDYYSANSVVRDGNLLTARGRAFIEFGIQFGEMLGLEFDPNWYGA